MFRMTKKDRDNHLQYMVLRPSDEWQRYLVPWCFSPTDVARKMPHSDVWCWLPKGCLIVADPPIHGPAWVYYQEDGATAAVEQDPSTLRWQDYNSLISTGTRGVTSIGT